MKRAILNLGSLTCVIARKAYLIMALLMSFAYVASAQVDCNVTMACNDGLQVSLDDACQAEVTPDMMLESPAYSSDAYTVELFDLSGNSLGTNTVTAAHLGMTIQASVTLNGCDNSCWGLITVEDKLAPVVICQDVTIACDANVNAVAQPQMSDACGGPLSVTSSDSIEDLPCSDDFGRIITRTYEVSDARGNKATCTQMISIERADLADVDFPLSYDGDEKPMITCGTVFPTNDDGTPSPSYTGFPSNISCPNIQFYYTDVTFEVCGAGQKVLRQWVVIDWCTGQERTDNQIIKVIDNDPPMCTAQPDFVDNISTDEGMCTGTYVVPAPIVPASECSEWDYIVGYKVRDENGDPFVNPSYENVTRLSNGQYEITGLPQDTSWIVYTITDACGNATQCFTEVFVSDQEAPNAICEGYSIVSLDDNGSGKIYATSVDDFSFDNCSDVTLAIRRYDAPCGHPEDTQFGEYVHLCCDDIANSPILVVLQVTDADGNVNECVANVNVQDKYAPSITCPDPVTLTCGDDYTDMSLTGGMATADDNCGVTVEFLGYTPNLNACGVGTVRKRFRVTDPQGRTASCTQLVTITNPNPFSESDITWPADITVSSCDMGDLDSENTGLPILSNDACASIAKSEEDQIFTIEDEFCFKILRTWRIVDECSDNIASGDFYTHKQKITVINSEAPTFTSSCANQSVVAPDDACDAAVTITVEAEDDCTPSQQLKYTYTVDYDNNGSIDLTGNTNDASGTYPPGSHKVVFTVVDQCDNERSCSSIVTVRDGKAPTPVCLGEVVWVLDPDGTTEVWASDFNLKSTDFCDGEDLTYSFNASGSQTALSFDCGDIPNGMAAEITLNMYAIDKSGNSDFCEVTLILQDSPNNDACTNQGNIAGRIQGQIVNDDLVGINAVDVDIFAMENEEEMNHAVTDDEGTYEFAELPFLDGYMVQPTSSGSHSNGVSTLDLVLVQRHILGLQDLEGAHKLIAADVNGSSNISGADIVELRKVILGVREEFTNNTSWKFIPTNFEFEDPAYPWTYPTEIELEQLFVDTDEMNFYGIKIGDVNGTATNLYDEAESEVRSSGLSLSIVNTEFTSGSAVSLPVIVESGMDIEGMQMTINFDATVLSFNGITADQASISTSHINATQAERGIITISYDDVLGLELNADDILMSLDFIALTDASVDGNLEINSEVLAAEAYDLSHNTVSVTLDIRDEYRNQNNGHVVLTTTPNPFSDVTNIRFTLPADQSATITVLDASGRVMMNMTRAFTAGVNTVEVTRDQLSSDGLYYYQLETAERTIVKKMIMVK